MRNITLIATGGTIEKTYDEQTGELVNRRSIVKRMLGRLRLEDAKVETIELLHKDSLFLTDSDRQTILDAARRASAASDGVVILHGTDTLTVTGDLLQREISPAPCPIVLTGAMRPFEMKQSDSLQNLTESIFATGILQPGVYCVAHGRALEFPGVAKDRARGTFVRAEG
jgi:L-asparaginase